MDHTYQRPLQLPACCSVLSAEEMTYTEGGALSINITPEQVMAFGDYWNDAEMLEWAGESFAMENAVPEIRARAKYIAPSNAEDGVARTIEELLLC